MKRLPSMERFRKALGTALRDLRKERRLSQEELAERMDLHRNYVSLVERGIQNITLETLYKIGDVLECSPAALLDAVEKATAGEVRGRAEGARTKGARAAARPSPAVYPPIRPPRWKVAEKNG